MQYDFYIDGGNIYADAQHTPVAAPRARPKFTYGDVAVLTLHFTNGVIEAGDGILVAIDTDMIFGQDGTSPMAEGRATATSGDVAAGTVELTVVTNTQRFYDIVNGAKTPLSAYMGIYVRRASVQDESYIQTELASGIVLVNGVVSQFTDTIVPLGPGDVYYTKQEVDANFIANAQKGAANGVAGLDATGKVPTGELPDMDYIPTSGGIVTGAILSTAGGYQQTIHTIPAASTTYTLEIGKVYEHSPAAAPIYTLPAVSDIYATADIAVIVVFSAAALSVAFVDSQGVIIPMLRTPDINAGQTYEFECTYNGGWKVMPVSMEVEE
ncbi:MAG: hypothetical protein IJS08_17005 [Victivallales bacterium]|nr:hypothetical protein [Victivallales bacterium]